MFCSPVTLRPYLCCIERQCLLQKGLCVGCQAVVYQQVSCIVKRQVAVRRRGRAQRLAQTLQGTAAVACGPPEQSGLIVDLPAWYSSLQTRTFVLLKINIHSFRSYNGFQDLRENLI